MAGVAEVFTVYGPLENALTAAAAVAFIVVLLAQGSAWMVATDRMQAVAGADGACPAFFGVFNPRFGTPVRVNVASGIIATAFMTAALVFLSEDDGEAGSLFAVVLVIATTTLLLSYLVIVPTLLALRRGYPTVDRPYRVPGGSFGSWTVTVVVMFWIALGTVVAVAPGALEAILGIDYNFEEIWGLDQFRVQAFTLGTLAALVAIALVGYAAARGTRQALQRALPGQPRPYRSG
jgi:amino acid transporter